jgi:UDP-glucuronate 4-epimerase
MVKEVTDVLAQPASEKSARHGDTPDSGTSKATWRIYNIENNAIVSLLDFIRAIEAGLGLEAKNEI